MWSVSVKMIQRDAISIVIMLLTKDLALSGHVLGVVAKSVKTAMLTIRFRDWGSQRLRTKLGKVFLVSMRYTRVISLPHTLENSFIWKTRSGNADRPSTLATMGSTTPWTYEAVFELMLIEWETMHLSSTTPVIPTVMLSIETTKAMTRSSSSPTSIFQLKENSPMHIDLTTRTNSHS